jgi:hypothetical protein
MLDRNYGLGTATGIKKINIYSFSNTTELNCDIPISRRARLK